MELSETSDSLIQTDLLNSNSSIMHLSLPKEFDTGLEEKEQAVTMTKDQRPRQDIKKINEEDMVIATSQEKKFKILMQLAETNHVRISIPRFIYTNSWSDIMHLFLPMRVYAGNSLNDYKAPELVLEQARKPALQVVPAIALTLQSEADQGTREKESLKEEQLSPTNNAEGVSQVSFPLTQFVSHDATSMLKILLNLQEHGETNCLKSELENQFAIKSLICYKCQGLGHIATECPIKILANEPSLELSKTSLKDCGNYVVSNCPNASISHLSLPKKDESGTGVTREEAKPHPIFSEDQVVRLEGKSLVVGSQRNELDHEYNKEPNNKWKPKEGQGIDPAMLELSTPTYFASKEVIIKVESLYNLLCGTQVSETPNMILYWNKFVLRRSFKNSVFIVPTSSIMHLIFPLSDVKGTGFPEMSNEVLGGESPKENTSTRPLQQQNVLEIIKCKPPMKRIESVLNTMLIKEEPPDSYQSPGKYLESQKRMKPNLVSVGTGKFVLRTKHFEEGEYDEDIGSNNSQDQIPKVDGSIMPCSRARRGDYKPLEYPIITKNVHHSRQDTPEEADIQGEAVLGKHDLKMKHERIMQAVCAILHDIEVFYTSKEVPRRHLYLPKLSRYKGQVV